MKKCSMCKTEKDFSLFSKRSSTKSGYKCYCKSCDKIYRLKNKDKIKQSNRLYKSKNKEGSRVYFNEYRKLNPHKFTHYNAFRRASLLQATPNWLSDNQKIKILDTYQRCSEISRTTNIKHHVDHIVPLKNEIVCGLHVPWNLRIITAQENQMKKNKFIEEISYGIV